MQHATEIIWLKVQKLHWVNDISGSVPLLMLRLSSLRANELSGWNHACFQGVGSRSGQLGRDSRLKSCDLVIRAHFILCLKDGSSAECRKQSP